jgi:hypothetical protein
MSDKAFEAYESLPTSYHKDPRLAYSIVVESPLIGHDKAWERVAKILREFKKKKHKGFHFEVEELARKLGYKIKVYKDQ